MAALILAEPDILLLNEPTNNLDRAGRRAAINLLRSWAESAMIVSHDFELLEEMDATLELTTRGAARHGGNYNAFRRREETELDAAQRAAADAEKVRAETVRRARQASERKARKDSAWHKSRARGDQPKALLDFAKGRAEASGGAGDRPRDAGRDAARETLSAAHDKIKLLQPVHMDIPSIGLPSGKLVLRVEGLTGGYDPPRPVIEDLSMTVCGPERIVVAGPNSSDKTMLLKLIAERIPPQSGKVALTVPFATPGQH